MIVKNQPVHTDKILGTTLSLCLELLSEDQAYMYY